SPGSRTRAPCPAGQRPGAGAVRVSGCRDTEERPVRYPKAIQRAVTEKRSAWLVLAVTAALSFALIAWGAAPTATATTPDVPASSQAAQVARLQQTLPSANITTALVVYSADRNTLSALNRAAL